MVKRRTAERTELPRRAKMMTGGIDIGGHPVLAIPLARLQSEFEREGATPETRAETQER